MILKIYNSYSGFSLIDQVESVEYLPTYFITNLHLRRIYVQKSYMNYFCGEGLYDSNAVIDTDNTEAVRIVVNTKNIKNNPKLLKPFEEYKDMIESPFYVLYIFKVILRNNPMPKWVFFNDESYILNDEGKTIDKPLPILNDSLNSCIKEEE